MCVCVYDVRVRGAGMQEGVEREVEGEGSGRRLRRGVGDLHGGGTDEVTGRGSPPGAFPSTTVRWRLSPYVE